MRLVLYVAAIAVLSVPCSALAKAPSKKDIDEALLRQSVEELSDLREAEAHHREGELQLERIQADLDVAWADQKAAKAWVDANQSILRAIEAQRKAADEGNRTDELATLAQQTVRSEASLAWRNARTDSAKLQVSFQQERVGWVKVEIDRRAQAAELERLRAYDVAIGGDPEVQQEIGRAQTKLGRLAESEGKARLKMERAEAKWQEAAAQASYLDPSKPSAE
ncbi:MAG: hypothetical protein GY898_13800 [Proteobacteria bacterium]|nr:hypothetical protein [Pseudomonadota bacterium]